MKPYRTLPILEYGEPLADIPDNEFLLTSPAPYVGLGACYGGSHPWRLRAGVLQALRSASGVLKMRQPGWQLKLFDAYRPNHVQEFMVHHEFLRLSGGRPPPMVEAAERAALWERTYRIWAEPSEDPATPPPHSTGAALDLTLADSEGLELDMGSPIDENSDRSLPDYFAERDPVLHARREFLREIMRAAGFRRHPSEWWHFCLGDQMWAWQVNREAPDSRAVARYGRADLLPD